MRDFSKKHRGVVHFGLWAEEGADERGNHDAWRILIDATQRCTTEDMRQDTDVIDALLWFERRAVRTRPVRDFRSALDKHDPMERLFATRDALWRIGREAGLVRE